MKLHKIKVAWLKSSRWSGMIARKTSKKPKRRRGSLMSGSSDEIPKGILLVEIRGAFEEMTRMCRQEKRNIFSQSFLAQRADPQAALHSVAQGLGQTHRHPPLEHASAHPVLPLHLQICASISFGGSPLCHVAEQHHRSPVYYLRRLPPYRPQSVRYHPPA